MSKSCQTPRGKVQSDDVVSFSPGGSLGKLRLALKSIYVSGPPRFWAVVEPYLSEGGIWRAQTSPAIVVEMSLLSAAMCHCVAGGRLYL